MTSSSVLIVDDDITILESLGDFLDLRGYHVRTAENGEAALAALKIDTPEIIVSDIMMPVMDGFQLHQAVRQNQAWATIPFIFLTAKGTPTDILRGTMEGVDAYITKPFEPETLIQVIEARLERSAAIEAVVDEEIAKTRGLLLNIFSHELRTPLTIIHGYVDILASGKAEFTKETLAQITRSMQASTERLSDLVHKLLLASTLESGMGRMIFEAGLEPVNLKEQCELVMKKLSQMAYERCVQIELAIDPGLVIESHIPYLSECLAHLVENAIRYNVDNGEVIILGRDDDGMVEISIKDSGIGIPQTEIPNVFERFHQVDRQKNEQQGVGVGLSIVSEVVKLHNGTIKLESEVGGGSTFTLYLPKIGGASESRD